MVGKSAPIVKVKMRVILMEQVVKFQTPHEQGLGDLLTDGPYPVIRVRSCTTFRKIGSIMTLNRKTATLEPIPEEEALQMSSASAILHSRFNTLQGKTTRISNSNRQTLSQNSQMLLSAAMRQALGKVPLDLHKFSSIGLDLYEHKDDKSVWVLQTETSADGQPEKWLCRYSVDEPLAKKAITLSDQIQPMSWVTREPGTTFPGASPQPSMPEKSPASLLFRINPDDVKGVTVSDGKMIIEFHSGNPPTEEDTEEGAAEEAPPESQEPPAPPPQGGQFAPPTSTGPAGARAPVPQTPVNY
jgi:hypothetical protein